MKIGIPTEVSLYHPAEFLELGKNTHAFLDMNLEEFKGGIKNQLLVGHIVHYIQNEGLDSIDAFPRYRVEYKEELIKKSKEKGIDLLNLGKDTFKLNWTKAEKLSNSTSVYQSKDPFEKASNVYTSSNYNMFHFLPFNRNIIKKHLATIIGSIRRNGVLSFPLMIHTNCIDGKWKYWIVDGQHRFEAFKKLGFPIRFTLYRPDHGGEITKNDIAQLIADVNNSSRKWSLHQFLKNWEFLDIPEYMKIKKVYEKTKISITTLLQAYSGLRSDKATQLFTKGIYRMEDEASGDVYVRYLSELKKVAPKSTKLYTAFLDFFRKYPDGYDNGKMLQIVKKEKEAVLADTIEGVLINLERLYGIAS